MLEQQKRQILQDPPSSLNTYYKLSQIDKHNHQFYAFLNRLQMKKIHPISTIDVSLLPQQPSYQETQSKSFKIGINSNLTSRIGMISNLKKQTISGAISFDSKQQDKGIEFKPRSSVNNRDRIRVRSVLKPTTSISKSKIEPEYNYSKQLNPQIKLPEPNIKTIWHNQINPNLTKIKQEYLNLNNNKKIKLKQSPLSRVNCYSSEKSSVLGTSTLKTKVKGETQQRSAQIHKLDLISKICPQKLCIQFLPYHDTLTIASSSNQIQQYFLAIFDLFQIPIFPELLIKRYKNCVYFGQKNPNHQSKFYQGFIWYFRQALYYGYFLNGQKHGQGVQIDIQNNHIWRGYFKAGRKNSCDQFKKQRNILKNKKLRNSDQLFRQQLEHKKNRYMNKNSGYPHDQFENEQFPLEAKVK